MTTQDLYSSLCVLCDDNRHRAGARFQTEVGKTRSEFNERGVLASSMYVQAVERAAATVFDEAAASMLGEVMAVHAAALPGDGAAIEQMLAAVYESRVRALAQDLIGERDGSLNVAASALNRDWRSLQVERLVDRVVAQGQARIKVAVIAAANNQPQPVSNTVNNYGSLASVVISGNNQTTVTQTVVTQVSPCDVKVALDALIQAQGIAPEQRAEVVEVLEQVKAEADRDRPNKLKLGGLIGGVRDVLEGLQAAPGAWGTVVGWYEVVKSAVT
jgi:hypothetical protein